MIPAQQMQRAVNRQKLHLDEQRVISLSRLAKRGFQRNHDVAQRHARGFGKRVAFVLRERQNIGRARLAAITLIEFGDFSIVGDAHIGFQKYA